MTREIEMATEADYLRAVCTELAEERDFWKRLFKMLSRIV